MNFSNKNILVLTDGSKGMISQAEGLAKEFGNKIIFLETKLIFPWSKLQPGILPIFFWIFLNKIILSVEPDLIISCGRKSVYLSIYFKRKYKKIINIHIQNPKVKLDNFNYVVAPEHDNIIGPNVICSIGAIHKFNKTSFQNINESDFRISKKNLICVIVGGSNNHYNFSKNEALNLTSTIKNIKKNNPEFNFLIITSRRTSDKVKIILRESLVSFTYVWNEKDKNPYTFALKNSNFFIITSDSTSMISECAYTQKPIYIFHLPFKRKSQRIERFHELFSKLNITKKLKEKNDFIPWTYKKIDETKRIAGIIKERIIKEKNELK